MNKPYSWHLQISPPKASITWHHPFRPNPHPIPYTSKEILATRLRLAFLIVRHFSISLFPQQRKLTGSSAQNSSGVHWCRHGVRFNEVPEKVLKVPGKVWDLVQRQVRFNRVPEVQRRFQEARVQSQVRSGEGQVTFNRIWRRSGRLWCIARWGSTGFRRMFRWRSGKLWCSARSGFWRRFLEKVCELCVQSQVRFNRALEKVPEKLLGSLGAKPSQVQRVSEKVAEKVPEKVLGIFGAGPGQVPTGSKGFQRLVSQQASERFVKIKCCGCWGYHRSLFLLNTQATLHRLYISCLQILTYEHIWAL